MEWLSSVIESTDSGWKILAIFLIGIYVLLWKFGGELLKLARENNTVAKQAHTVAKDAKSTVNRISTNITTNHGSKNLGDAIDRLTEWMLVHMHEQRATDTTLSELRAELVFQTAAAAMDAERIRSALTDLDERVSSVESKQ